MAVGWTIQQRSGNSGWVDACWSLSVGTVAAVVAIWPLEPNWPHWRQSAVAILVLAWGLRLGLHIVGRARTSADDPRYRDLIQQWGRDAPRRMFLFLQSQAAVGVVLAVSIALAAHNPNPELRLQDVLGLGILLVAIAGEAIADRQLHAFKANPQNRGKICDVETLEPVTSSELFLRVADLDRLSSHRYRLCRTQSIRLARARGAGLHVLGSGACLGNSAARAAHVADPRGCVPALSAPDSRIFPVPAGALGFQLAVTNFVRSRNAMAALADARIVPQATSISVNDHVQFLNVARLVRS